MPPPVCFYWSMRHLRKGAGPSSASCSPPHAGLRSRCWRSIGWTFATAGLLNLLVYPACLWLGSTLRAAEMPRLRHAWYDLPLRTILVCGLMAAILEASNWAGPMLTGLLAVFPISSTSLILILQPRIGGRAAAAVIAN